MELQQQKHKAIQQSICQATITSKCFKLKVALFTAMAEAVNLHSAIVCGVVSRGWLYLKSLHRCPMGLDVSVRLGWTAGWACWGSPETPDTFSSSLLLRQAAFGFRFRSARVKRKKEMD